MVVAGIAFSKFVEERVGATRFYVQDVAGGTDVIAGKSSLICAFYCKYYQLA